MSNCQARIIDQDVDFYVAEVEYCQDALRRCLPSREEYWKQRKTSAEAVLQALRAYRTVIDNT